MRNKLLTFILSLTLATFSSVGFANIMGTDREEVKTTNLSERWTCTTNASRSDVEADKIVDKEMAEKKKSAVDAFSFAAKHCRDCTKITCEFHDKDDNGIF